MASNLSLAGFCRLALSANNSHSAADPASLGKLFRQYAGIERTPSLMRAVELVRSLGINIGEVDYLRKGGANMKARGVWYIHYSAHDRPAIQKFTIFHELFEILRKSFAEITPAYQSPQEPEMNPAARRSAERSADRFASAVLLSPQFLISHLIATGCDVVKLAEGLELSHQCLLIAMEQHLRDIPFVGAIFDYQLPDGLKARQKTYTYNTTLVVKTLSAQRLKPLCKLQPEPVLHENPTSGSLVCAAVHGGFPVFYHNPDNGDAAVLVRTIFSASRIPSRIILLALPSGKSDRFYPQVEVIQAIMVNKHSACPATYKCRSSLKCQWKT